MKSDIKETIIIPVMPWSSLLNDYLTVWGRIYCG